MKRFTLILILCFLGLNSLQAQNAKKTREIEDSLRVAPITMQFQELIVKSPSYKEYKNIKLKYLRTFGVNLKDSIAALDAEIENLKTELASEKEVILKLNSDIKSRDAQIQTLQKEKESFEVFGILTTKATYSNTVGFIIIALIVLLLFFIYKFKNSNSITTKALADLKELEEEFEAHRKTALAREQKAMRRLQDEINKHKTS